MYDKIISLFDSNNNIFIYTHVDPDGDTIGSALALKHALELKNKKVSLFYDNNISDTYSFLPGFKDINPKAKTNDVALVISVDCADESRLCCNNTKIDINIDHHLGNSNFAKINFIDSKAAATGEIIYDLIKHLGLDINRDIAMCLYVAIATDTGNFAYSNTTQRTFQIVSHLLKTQIYPGEISRQIYEQMNFEQLKNLGEGLVEMKQESDGRLIWTCIDNYKDMAEVSIIDYLRKVKTCKIAVVFKKVDKNNFKVSLRSKDNIDVRSFAQRFGGGGHYFASGFTVNGSQAEVITNVLKELKKLF